MHALTWVLRTHGPEQLPQPNLCMDDRVAHQREDFPVVSVGTDIFDPGQ